MSAELADYLGKAKLTDHELDRAFAIMMSGEAAPDQVMPFLLASIPLMNDARAIAAGAKAMRERMVTIAAPPGAIDVCGTGGDGAHTLNVSTAVALVVAGAGVPVAKHGNRAMSSRCGAADVLEALGVKLTADSPTLERALHEAGVAFLFAQNHHPAMRHVAAARRELGKRTIFNLLGPLSNPGRVKRQLVGVFTEELVAPMAEALGLLGSELACVVHGAGNVDELTLHLQGVNRYAMMNPALSGIEVLDFNVSKVWPNLPATTPDDLRGGGAEENAQALLSLLKADAANEAYKHTVLLNAALALAVSGRADDWSTGWSMAGESLASGAALQSLRTLISVTAAAP